MTLHEVPKPIEDKIESLRIMPYHTVARIAQLCEAWSDATHEVYCRIECVNGKPVGFMVRESREVSIPDHLRRKD